MTFPELTNSINRTVNDLKRQYDGNLMVNVGVHARKMIFDRVTKSGKDASGGAYRPYSTKAMLVGCKSMNASVCNSFFGKEKNKEHKWITVNGRHLAVLEGGYKKFRELHGRQTAHVDFSFTNRMWNDITLISDKTDHQSGVAIIGARQEEEKKKLAGNTKHRGDILDLSKSEQQELVQRYNLETLQVFKNNGL